MDNPEAQVINYQKHLFELLVEFFQRATGNDIQSFATFESFDDEVRSSSTKLVPRLEDAFQWADNKLRSFYADEGLNAFKSAQKIAGLKLLLGGGSRFGESQFESVKSSLLYADTILVPDPVFPWLESDRHEERFRHVLFLRLVFSILHLSPLIDTDLPYPAVLVFPSWEKMLEEHDEQTQKAIQQLVADMIAHYVDPGIQTFEDILPLIESSPDRFLEEVQRNNLFVAPGGPIAEPLQDALKRYEQEIERWRTPEWVNQYRELPFPKRVLHGIMERVSPQYHLLENSEEFHSHPLLSIEQQVHYFRLISVINNVRLVHLGVLDKRRQVLVESLSSKQLRWLCHVPIDALVELRKNNENTVFRKRMEEIVRSLHDSTVDDIDRVSEEVSHEIDNIIAEHEQEILKIQRHYNRKHGKTSIGAGLALVVELLPSLAPFLGKAAPLAIAAKYAWDKIEEHLEKRALSKSLMGVLALTKKANIE